MRSIRLKNNIKKTRKKQTKKAANNQNIHGFFEVT